MQQTRRQQQRQLRQLHRQRGVALAYAVFFMVIVALALTLMVRWQGVQTATAGSGLQYVRALAAANAGISWQLYQIRIGGNCPSPATQTLNLSEGALNGFAVTVICSRSNALVEGVNTLRLYTLSARAQFGSYSNNPDYVSRQVSLTATL